MDGLPGTDSARDQDTINGALERPAVISFWRWLLSRAFSSDVSSQRSAGSAVPHSTSSEHESRIIAESESLPGKEETQSPPAIPPLSDANPSADEQAKVSPGNVQQGVMMTEKIRHLVSLFDEHVIQWKHVEGDINGIQTQLAQMNVGFQNILTIIEEDGRATEHRKKVRRRRSLRHPSSDYASAGTRSHRDSSAMSARQAVQSDLDPDLDLDVFSRVYKQCEEYAKEIKVAFDQARTIKASWDRLQEHDRRLQKKLEHFKTILAHLPALLPELDESLPPKYLEQVESDTESIRDDKSDTPSLLAEFFDRKGDVGVYQERLLDLECWYAESLLERDLIQDRGDRLHLSDEKFQARYQRQRREIEEALEDAERDATRLETLCRSQGYNTAPQRRASSSSPLASNRGQTELAVPSAPIRRISLPRMLNRPFSQSSVDDSSGVHYTAGWLEGVPIAEHAKDPGRVDQLQAIINGIQSFQATHWTSAGLNSRESLLDFAEGSEAGRQGRRRSLA